MIQNSFSNELPTLYMVATPIGNLDEMTVRAVNILKEVNYIACEDTRNTKNLCRHFNIETQLIAHHDHNQVNSAQGIVDLMAKGNNIALVSDAGYPGISDPGTILVKEVIKHGYNVVPVSGSSAFINALVVSGFETNHFLFYGFLAHKRSEKLRQLKQIPNCDFPIIFYESPHRIKETLECLLETFGDRQICIGRELTKRFETFYRLKISEMLEEVENIKGEMVLILESNYEEIIIEHDYNQIIEQLKQEGLTNKDIVKRLVREYAMKKNDAYNLVHQD